jgi:hypothetical protein
MGGKGSCPRENPWSDADAQDYQKAPGTVTERQPGIFTAKMDVALSEAPVRVAV